MIIAEGERSFSINQQFTLRFFINYTQLNTEYFYLLIARRRATFLIFGTERAPLDNSLVRSRPVHPSASVRPSI